MWLVFEYFLVYLSSLLLMSFKVDILSMSSLVMSIVSLVVFGFHREIYGYISERQDFLVCITSIVTNGLLIWIQPELRELYMWLVFTMLYIVKYKSLKDKVYLLMTLYWWGWWLIGYIGAQALGIL